MTHTLFARIGGDQWYAIPPALELAFREAGADVCTASELPSAKPRSDALGVTEPASSR